MFMLEIYAEQDGIPVQLAPGKSIEVVLFSEIFVSDLNEKPAFNIYKLDTTSRKWAYYGPNDLEFLDDISFDENDPLAEAKDALLVNFKDIERKKDAALAELPSTRRFPRT